MKFSIGYLPLLLALFENNANAFAPTGMTAASRQSTARGMQSLQDVMSTFSIADLDAAGLPVSDVAAAAPAAAAAQAFENNGAPRESCVPYKGIASKLTLCFYYNHVCWVHVNTALNGQ